MNSSLDMSEFAGRSGTGVEYESFGNAEWEPFTGGFGK